MDPIVWTRSHPTLELWEGRDPDVGSFTIKGPGYGDGREPYYFGFAAQLAPGDDYATIRERCQAMLAEDERAFTSREYQLLRSKVRGGLMDTSYSFSPAEAQRLIGLARSRPKITDTIDNMLLGDGYEMKHVVHHSYKCYDKKIKYGYLSITRSQYHIHMTFTRTTAHSWDNIFRFVTELGGHNTNELWPVIWPDYLDSLEVGTLLALSTGHQFEAEGLNKRRARK